MNKVAMILALLGLGAVTGLDYTLRGEHDASLLIGLLFWSGVAQGAIALLAAGALADAGWMKPLEKALHDFAPVLIVFPLGFLLFGRDLSAYGWHHHPTAWLRPDFFVARNVAMLSVTFVLAVLYLRASRKESAAKGTLAVLYLFAFVVTQSLAAFDWVMSFEYPWISTMFGPLFFVEAIFGGIALAVIVAVALNARSGGAVEATLRDTVTLMFGFSLLWGGLFFAQYLTIWYGNIPEEVGAVQRRLAEAPYLQMSIFMLFGYFVIPFGILMSGRAKTMPIVVVPLALLVLATFVVEKLVYLMPVTKLSPLHAGLGWLLLGLPFLYLVFTAAKRTAGEEGRA